MIDFMHLQLGSGRVTVAIDLEDNTARVAAAYCSPRDNFSRSKGRLISTSRLACKRKNTVLFTSQIPEGQRVKSYVHNILMAKFIDGGDDIPQWVTNHLRNQAKRLLKTSTIETDSITETN